MKNKNECNETLLNTLYKVSKLSMNSIEDVLPLTKDKIFQTTISEVHSKYEVIKKECEMIAKAQQITLTPVDCITKFKNWANVRIDALFDCSTQNLAKILYGGTCCEIAEVIVDTVNCEECEKEIYELAEKLSNLQEHHIHTLKQILLKKENAPNVS